VARQVEDVLRYQAPSRASSSNIIPAELHFINSSTAALGTLVTGTSSVSSFATELLTEMYYRQDVLNELLIDLSNILEKLPARSSAKSFRSLRRILEAARSDLNPNVYNAGLDALETIGEIGSLLVATKNRTYADFLADELLMNRSRYLNRLLWDYSPNRTVLGRDDAIGNNNERVYDLYFGDPAGFGIISRIGANTYNVRLANNAEAVTLYIRGPDSGYITLAINCYGAYDIVPTRAPVIRQIYQPLNGTWITTIPDVVPMNNGYAFNGIFNIEANSVATLASTGVNALGAHVTFTVLNVEGPSTQVDTLVDWLWTADTLSYIMPYDDTSMGRALLTMLGDDIRIGDWFDDQNFVYAGALDGALLNTFDLLLMPSWYYLRTFFTRKAEFIRLYEHFYDVLNVFVMRAKTSTSIASAIVGEV
jgi:hypothetical protein